MPSKSTWIATLAIVFLLGSPIDASWKQAEAEFKLAIASKDADQILEAIEGLAQFPTAAAASLIIDHGIMYDDIDVHEECFNFLAGLKDADAQKLIVKTARKSKRWELRAQCARVLASYSGLHTRTVLEELLVEDKRWNVRAAAIRALAFHRHKSSVPILIERIKTEPTRRVRWDLVQALQNLTANMFEDEYLDWAQWWAREKDRFSIPSKEEIAKMRAQEKKAQELKTAVAEGLYGPIYSEKVAFIFDISGSMSVGTDMKGTRLDIAKRELNRVIGNLSPKGYFNVIAFSDEVHMFKKHLVKTKKKNLEKAIKFIDKLPSGGETNAFAALQAAFMDKDVDTIYFLTDGSPTLGDEGMESPVLIRNRITDWNRDRMVIVNCIGFFPGQAMNEDKKEAQEFLLKLAHENDGFYKEIY